MGKKTYSADEVIIETSLSSIYKSPGFVVLVIWAIGGILMYDYIMPLRGIGSEYSGLTAFVIFFFGFSFIGLIYGTLIISH